MAESDDVEVSMGTTPMLTDSGLETWLIFHKGIDLPDFASFTLLHDAAGRNALAEYFRDHLAVAAEAGAGIVLETPTWRANANWGARRGYDAAALDQVNRDAVAFLQDLASEFDDLEVIVSGNVGPHGDGYNPDELLSPETAEAYHRPQIESFAAAGADRITMLTATHTGEAIGVVQAAVGAGLPVVIAFTVETDGVLASGQFLSEAVSEVDEATGGAALHFGVNCAHPDHFVGALDPTGPGVARLGLLRANASRMSHAELDEADVLDDGNPGELAALYAELRRTFPHFQVLGGCCGTDVRHVRAIADACIAPIWPRPTLLTCPADTWKPDIHRPSCGCSAIARRVPGKPAAALVWRLYASKLGRRSR